MKTLIYNAEIVNEGRRFHGGLLIDGDRIAEVFEGDAPASHAALCPQNCINAGNALLLPGIIDTHVHFREPGLTHKADIAHESRAALAGGVTSTMDMPNVNPPTTTLERWQERMALGAQQSRVNYAYYLGATNGSGEREEEREARIPLKLFMGSSTGNMLVDNPDTLRRLFHMSACHANSNTAHAAAPFPIVAHCEDTPRISERMAEAKARWGEDPDVEHHPWIRDAEACFRSSSLAAELARETGARLHIAHISTERELSLLSEEASPGSRLPHITGEVCIAHLLFCDEDYKRLGTRIKCNPAVKSRQDRDALRHALADGRLLTVATDHAPHLLSEKQGGCVRAASGMPMVQFSLVSMLGLVDEGILPIERVVDAMCHQPARLFGIKGRGYLRPGYKADLVLVKPEEWTLRREDILSKCGWSPLEGCVLHWRVQQTFVNGRLAYDHGHINDNLRGEALAFEYCF
ncbi:MAG: dihydroorotase [Bacteroidaceae bacterium]|nr:dihydroorotase [Bacteroidaceae bacterium]